MTTPTTPEQPPKRSQRKSRPHDGPDVARQLRAAAASPRLRRGPKKKGAKDAEAEPQDARLTFRMTKAAKAAILAAAAERRLTPPDYFRVVVLNAKPLRAVRAPSAALHELVLLRGQIGKLGGNINQLARLANEGRGPFTKAEALAAVADITAMRFAVLKVLGVKDIQP